MRGARPPHVSIANTRLVVTDHQAINRVGSFARKVIFSMVLRTCQQRKESTINKPIRCGNLEVFSIPAEISRRSNSSGHMITLLTKLFSARMHRLASRLSAVSPPTERKSTERPSPSVDPRILKRPSRCSSTHIFGCFPGMLLNSAWSEMRLSTARKYGRESLNRSLNSESGMLVRYKSTLEGGGRGARWRGARWRGVRYLFAFSTNTELQVRLGLHLHWIRHPRQLAPLSRAAGKHLALSSSDVWLASCRLSGRVTQLVSSKPGQSWRTGIV